MKTSICMAILLSKKNPSCNFKGLYDLYHLDSFLLQVQTHLHKLKLCICHNDLAACSMQYYKLHQDNLCKEHPFTSYLAVYVVIYKETIDCSNINVIHILLCVQDVLPNLSNVFQ